MTTKIHLVRHGYVENPQQILYGRLPGFGLSSTGQEQAKAAARALSHKPIKAVFCSPMLRAQQTAKIILGSHSHLAPQVSEDINEVIMEAYEGRPLAELEKINWQFYDNVIPPSEMPSQIVQRIRRFFAKVRTSYRGEEVVAVTHGDIVCFSIIFARKLPINGASKFEIDNTIGYPATASITSMMFKTDNPDEIPTYEYMIPY